MQVSIVHDYLNQMGGAEKVVLEFHQMFPQAKIYTSIYDEKHMPDFKGIEISTSFMQKLPFIFPLFKYYLPFYPLAFESLKIHSCDVVLSSSSAFAKLTKPPRGAKHICYCHTPARFLWMYDMYMKRENVNQGLKKILPAVLAPMQKWDKQTLDRVDHFIANSRNVQERIRRIYNRESEVINPPVDTDFYQIQDNSADYFLLVSRLNTYKRIDLAVETFNQLQWPLKIVGGGPDLQSLKAKASSNIEFLGRLTDDKLKDQYAACRALIFPGEEDFGIIPLEAMACGRPVIAYKAGGALETVIEDKTGIFFEQQTTESLKAALLRFASDNFEKMQIREHAKTFDKTVFRKKILDFLRQKV